MNPEAETVRDAELLEAVGGGDERAFAELHRRYAAVVFSFVLARTADRGAAEEVSADELVAALRSLPEDLAEVVDLAWLHELPYAQIASTLGIPAGTVKSRVSRARRILKDALRKDALRSDDA